MVAFMTAAFVQRRRVLEPMFLGSLGDFEPKIARMIEILVFGFVSYILYIFFALRIIAFMPEWVLRPSMWAAVAIFTAIAFFCWSYSENLRGPKREVALSAMTGSMVALAFEAVNYIALRYSQDWIYAGGFYLLIPVILAFAAAYKFADKPLVRYADADVDEQPALWRLRKLRLIFRPSRLEMFLFGMSRETRLRQLS